MCGLAGWFGAPPDDRGLPDRMIRALRHRGPDGWGVREWPGAALYHTRLSILDLSPAGAQPMSNRDGTVWTVFNGEIYNHRELRRELESHGCVFRGRSDTEVLAYLYERDGAAFIEKLRGMFALALYDLKNRKLILARDRFGIKPLFYAPGERRLAFASEIGALLEFPGVERTPDPQAIYDFAALFYIPAPETFYAGIKALQPGEIIEAALAGDCVPLKARCYHHWTVAPDRSLTVEQAVERGEELLSNAVTRQKESDVPLGALLSGGIDSSLVSTAAQRSGGGGLRTFNVRFQDAEFDETPAALAVARHIGSDHTVLSMDEIPGTWQRVTDLLRHAGQPFADTSLFAVHALSELMARHVTVALSGDGGDEGFGGYEVYRHASRVARLQRLPAGVWSFGEKLVNSMNQLGCGARRLPPWAGDLSRADDTSIVQTLWCWMREAEHRALCRDIPALPVRRLFEPQWRYDLDAGSRIERLSAQATEAIARLTLPNDFLFKVDLASMKEGLEIRVPFLDEELFGFGLSLPHRMKVRGQNCKHLLRAIAARWLPAEVARKPKHGFGIPVDAWVTPEFKSRLKRVLLNPSSRLSDFFRPEIFRPVVEAFCDGRPFPGVSRQGLYQRAIMFLSVDLALSPGQA